MRCGKKLFLGEHSESNTHMSFDPYRRTGKDCLWIYNCQQLLLAMDRSQELFPKLITPSKKRPHNFGEDSKLGNSLTLGFFVPKLVIRHYFIQLEAVRMPIICEENNMNFCLTMFFESRLLLPSPSHNSGHTFRKELYPVPIVKKSSSLSSFFATLDYSLE